MRFYTSANADRPATPEYRGGMLKLGILGILVTVMACGTTSGMTSDDDGTPGDGARPRDGALEDPVATDVTCQARVHVQTNADGSRTESTTNVALLDVSPFDEYWIEQCDQVTVVNGVTQGSCGAGATCTDTGAPPPRLPLCFWSFRPGQFESDGRLSVICGSRSRSFNAAGAQLLEIESRFTTTRIHRR
jgi:hypothetical protein